MTKGKRKEGRKEGERGQSAEHMLLHCMVPPHEAILEHQARSCFQTKKLNQ